MKFPSVVALGGGSEIGASCYWYRFPWPGSKYGYLSVVADCGMRPRDGTGPDLTAIDHVDFIFISHPHADHSVYVPLLAKMFPSAVIFVIEEGFAMCASQWKESVSSFKRQERESGARPPYGEADVARMVREQVRYMRFWNRIELPANMSVFPPEAGHMLGAASFYFSQNLGVGKKCTVFHAVDISFEEQCLIRGAPKVFTPKDGIQTVVGDATNLTIETPSRAEEIKRFIAAVREVLAQNGRVIIPVFKYHKAQEIWEILVSNGIPPALVFVDGNAAELFGIYERYTRIHRLPATQIIGRGEHARWQRWSARGPRIVLAFGGMVQENSPAWHNARAVIENENDAFFTVGYTDPCSPGGEILDHFVEGKTEISLGLKSFTIRCRVERFKLGSHGGHSDLMGLAERARDRVIWVHGEDKRVQGFLKDARHHLQGRNGKEVRI